MKQNVTLRSNQPPGHILSPVEAHDMCSSTPAGLVGAACLCLVGCYLSPSYICLFGLCLSCFNNSSMPVRTTWRSLSNSADSILQVPSTTFNISHLSVYWVTRWIPLRCLSPRPEILHTLFFTSYLCQIYVSSAHSYCLGYCQWWFYFGCLGWRCISMWLIYQIMFVPMSIIYKISINFMSEFHMSFKRLDCAFYFMKDGNKRRMTGISNLYTIIADLYIFLYSITKGKYMLIKKWKSIIWFSLFLFFWLFCLPSFTEGLLTRTVCNCFLTLHVLHFCHSVLQTGKLWSCLINHFCADKVLTLNSEKCDFLLFVCRSLSGQDLILGSLELRSGEKTNTFHCVYMWVCVSACVRTRWQTLDAAEQLQQFVVVFTFVIQWCSAECNLSGYSGQAGGWLSQSGNKLSWQPGIGRLHKNWQPINICIEK